MALTIVAWSDVAFAQAIGPNVSKAAKISKPEMTRVFGKNVRKLLERAFEEEEAGNQEAALELFEEAHGAGKSAATDAELGLAHLRAKNYILAARHLTSALTNYELRILGRSKDYILDKLDAAKKEVGTLNVRVNVPKSVVNVDGEIVRDWPFHEQIFVVPGKHNVKATKPGYWMSHINLDIDAGQTKEVTFTLQERIREEVYNMARPLNINLNASTATSAEKEPEWVKPLLIGSGIGLAIGGGFLILGLTKRSTADNAWISFNEASRCAEPANAVECATKRDEAAARRDFWENVAIAGGIGTAASVAGVVIGLVSRPSNPAQVTIQPAVDSGQVGGSVTGVF